MFVGDEQFRKARHVMGAIAEVIARAGDQISRWIEQTGNSESCKCVTTESVYWVGGPLDGMIKELDGAAIWHLPAAIEMPVNLIHQKPSSTRTSRRALYGLTYKEGRWVYGFEGVVLSE